MWRRLSGAAAAPCAMAVVPASCAAMQLDESDSLLPRHRRKTVCLPATERKLGQMTTQWLHGWAASHHVLRKNCIGMNVPGKSVPALWLVFAFSTVSAFGGLPPRPESRMTFL